MKNLEHIFRVIASHSLFLTYIMFHELEKRHFHKADFPETRFQPDVASVNPYLIILSLCFYGKSYANGCLLLKCVELTHPV